MSEQMTQNMKKVNMGLVREFAMRQQLDGGFFEQVSVLEDLLKTTESSMNGAVRETTEKLISYSPLIEKYFVAAMLDREDSFADAERLLEQEVMKGESPSDFDYLSNSGHYFNPPM